MRPSTPDITEWRRTVARPRTAAALAVVAVTGALVGLGWLGSGALGGTDARSSAATDSERFVAGYYLPSQLIDLAGNTVDAGTYRISYAADVRFEAPTPGTTLTCALRDPNSPGLRFEPDSSTVVTATGAVQHVEFSGIYALPPMSFGVRCHASVAGSVRALFTNIQLDTRTG